MIYIEGIVGFIVGIFIYKARRKNRIIYGERTAVNNEIVRIFVTSIFLGIMIVCAIVMLLGFILPYIIIIGTVIAVILGIVCLIRKVCNRKKSFEKTDLASKQYDEESVNGTTLTQMKPAFKEKKVENDYNENGDIDSVICPSCNKQVKSGVKYCNFCGSEVGKKEMLKEDFDEKVICQACGKSVKKGIKFCNFCGGKMKVL